MKSRMTTSKPDSQELFERQIDVLRQQAIKEWEAKERLLRNQYYTAVKPKPKSKRVKKNKKEFEVLHPFPIVLFLILLILYFLFSWSL